MKAIPLAIPEVMLVETVLHGDKRGAFMEDYSRRDFETARIPGEFVQDNYSMSVETGVLRGLHYQAPPHAQAKLIRVLRGRIFDAAVDIRRGSPTYGQHVSVELAAGSGQQVYIPTGFAHGFLTMEPDTEIAYKVTDYYSPESDFGLRWDDPEIGIDWPLAGAAPLLSDKDKDNPPLADLGQVFSYDG